jgi:hypothetical protein
MGSEKKRARDRDRMQRKRAEEVARVSQLRTALSACRTELYWCKQQLASVGYESREGGSVMEALRLAEDALK